MFLFHYISSTALLIGTRIIVRGLKKKKLISEGLFSLADDVHFHSHAEVNSLF